MKFRYLFVGMTLCALTASGADGYRSVAINLNDGTKVEVNLTDQLEASFQKDNLVVTGVDADVKVPKSAISSFTFSKLTGIGSVSAGSAAPVVEGGSLVFGELPDGTVVTVCSQNGQVISSATVSGFYSVSMASLPQGVVLVSVGGVTYKIVVK